MKITKKKLDDIKRCYAVSSMYYDDVNHYIFASEDPDVICESFKEKILNLIVNFGRRLEDVCHLFLYQIRKRSFLQFKNFI